MFLLIFTGGQMEMLKKKFLRILESFGVPKYEIPGNLGQFDDKINQIETNLKEIKSVIDLIVFKTYHPPPPNF